MNQLIGNLLQSAARASFGLGGLPEFTIDQPPPGQSGDIATNLAFGLAHQLKRPPKEIAEQLANHLRKKNDLIAKVEVGGAGFLNITLTENFLANQAGEILLAGKRYGYSSIGKGKKARVEFVSANPTGPLHIGNARGGPLGDVIANILQAVGYNVLREYLHNDIGGQVKKFGESLIGKSQEYKGEYIKELTKKIGSVKDADKAGKKAVDLILKEILDDCKAMGIEFDVKYKESDFSGPVKTGNALEGLPLKRDQDALWYEVSGARETVVVRSTGEPTYFADDIAYHRLKFEEGYDLVIDVLGSNHHGHVPKLQKVVKDLGYDIRKFKVVLYQFVRVKRGDKVVKMSKRAGTFVTAREVLDEVGKDAFRFFMLLHDPNTHMDFDLELAKKKSQENPVFYVQYAAVRAKSILRKSEIQNPKSKTNSKLQITNQIERKLIIKLLRFPDLVEELAKLLQVHQLTHYAIDVARSFHDFYERAPVIEKGGVNQSRLAMVKATLVVLENTLQLLGVDIPDKM